MEEDNRIPLADTEDAPYLNSVSLFDGVLALYKEIGRKEGRLEQHIWAFTKEETKKLYQVLHEHLSNVNEEKRGEHE